MTVSGDRTAKRRSASSTLLAIAIVLMVTSGLALTAGTARAMVEVTPTIQGISDGAAAWQTDMAVDMQDRVHLCFSNDDGELYYANETNGSIVVQLLEGEHFAGVDCSIAVDTHGHVHLSYTDDVARDLYYATNSSGTWRTHTVDEEGVVGGSSRIAVDSQDRVHISYLGNGLKYATGSGTSWDVSTIDGSCNEIHAMVLDTEDRAFILYSDVDFYKHADNVGGSWSTENIVLRSFVQGGSVTIDGKDRFHFALVVDGDLLYANDTSGSWSAQVVAPSAHHEDCHIALDAQGHAHITYTDSGRTNLYYATNLGGTWSTNVIDERGEGGSIHGGPLAVDSEGVVHVAYLKDDPDLGPASLVVHYATFAPLVRSAPGVPVGLTAIYEDGQVRLNWTAPTSDGGSAITGYRLYWSPVLNGTYSSVLVNGTSYLHVVLDNGTTIYYIVSAINQLGEGAMTSMISVVLGDPSALPSAPTALSASYINGGISLNWTAPGPSNNITGYRIYRGADPSSLSPLVMTSSTQFRDTDILGGETYYYMVRAVNDAGEGEVSEVISATVPGSHSGNVPFLDSMEGQVAMAGLAVVAVGAAGFLIWRRMRA